MNLTGGDRFLPPGQYVYCVEGQCAFKVGTSRAPCKRADEIERAAKGAYGQLILRLRALGSFAEETALHRRLAEWRIPRTEWFAMTPDSWAAVCTAFLALPESWDYCESLEAHAKVIEAMVARVVAR